MFFTVKTAVGKNKTTLVQAEFNSMDRQTLMVKGGKFYAVWDEESGLWSTDEYDVMTIVDREVKKFFDDYNSKADGYVTPIYLSSPKAWQECRKYIQNKPDWYVPLDSKLTFANTKTKRSDYVSKRLPYDLEDGSIDAYNEMMSVLYLPGERQKLEWAIGSVLAGDSKKIQKFIALYGEGGTGKSTVIDIITDMFPGYCSVCTTKDITKASNQFALYFLKDNPLIVYDHDGDLSRVDDNSTLNKMVGHEKLEINEKNKSQYTMRSNAMLFLGTNSPVKITDSKSGMIRRLIDVSPTGNTLPRTRYEYLKNKVRTEIPAIAKHCYDVYQNLGYGFYDDYKSESMIEKTNVMYNFIKDNLFEFVDGITLTDAWKLYNAYADDSNIPYKMRKMDFKSEFLDYFEGIRESKRVGDKIARNWYYGFKRDKFKSELKKVEKPKLSLTCKVSLLDKEFAAAKAQLEQEGECPLKYKWDNCKVKLKDVDTSKVHYLKLPDNHIVIDFDIKNLNGDKDRDANLEEALKWPETYAEFSKSGAGVHLHYIYDGDVEELASKMPGDNDIEIKRQDGGRADRRMLTYCNDKPIAHLKRGDLPLKKKEDSVVDTKPITDEKHLVNAIKKALRKGVHDSTACSVDYIYKVLNDAYTSGMTYDVRHLEKDCMTFASKSTHQSAKCIKQICKCKFCSDNLLEDSEQITYNETDEDAKIAFFDIEVYPNLFLIVWKYEDDSEYHVLVNPSKTQVIEVLSKKLAGFNNRDYDNHVCWEATIDNDTQHLSQYSQRLINKDKDAKHAMAYNVSYIDVMDLSAQRGKSLKAWECELGIAHKEMEYPWDEPLDESHWDEVIEYCKNDVAATEAVFHALGPQFAARKILADISGKPVNAKSNAHTEQIIFGDDKNPQSKFVYTDLSTIFPGYTWDATEIDTGEDTKTIVKSSFMGDDPSEGGYVYVEPGMYKNVALLDIASMHPTSLVNLNFFGPYTERFKMLLDARIAIKHKEYDKVAKMFDGKLAKYVTNDKDAKMLSNALKIPINSVYGLTSAHFENRCRDPRNRDNIVAKRGALFMISLKNEVQKLGYTVAHIKTDSIKIPDADDFIINFVMEYGKKYGYTFEHEDTYERMCIVNKACYIAKSMNEHKDTNGWTATAAQFQVPYVFKTLFSGEEIVFDDLCEIKTVAGGAHMELYLNENGESDDECEKVFVGKAGKFTPILSGNNAGEIRRINADKGQNGAVTGTKGFRWLESEDVKDTPLASQIDYGYYDKLVSEARKTMSKYGDVDKFIGGM